MMRRGVSQSCPRRSLQREDALVKQLTGLDATFLYMETPTTYGHVSSIAIYERPDDADFDPLIAAREMVESHLDIAEPYRRRLVGTPLGIDRPYWIEDPDFDLDYHVRHMSLPHPGTDQQLADQVARIQSRHCDRTRPLWELYVIEGLASGDFAVLTKMHHATVDGAAGAILTTMMLDTEPDAPLAVPGPLPDKEPVPSERDMFLRSLGSLARRPDRTIRLQLRIAQQFAESSRLQGPQELINATRRVVTGARRRHRTDRDSAPEAPDRPAPRTSFNAMLSPHRRVAFKSVPMERIKGIKNAAGATVNDIVMAACAGALRNYLEALDELPDDPLIGMVPVSIRTGSEEEIWTNRVSGLFCQLPTHLADPLERIAFIHDAMAEAKGDFDLLPAEAMVELAEMAPPALAGRRCQGFRGVSNHRPGEPADEPRDLQRPRPTPAAVSARRQDVALHPGEHDHRRRRAEHHRAELLRHARLRPGRRLAAGARPLVALRSVCRRDRRPRGRC